MTKSARSTNKDRRRGSKNLQLNESKFALFRWLSLGLFLLLTSYFAYHLYFQYQDYVAPENVYGEWIEIGAPSYSTERLTLSEQGFFRNNRLVATQYQFDGKRITVETGNGLTIYEVAGNSSSPQLKRLQPASPAQRFVKKGYEDTISENATGGAQNRRAALSEHFGSSK